MGWLGPQSQVEATLMAALLSSEHKRHGEERFIPPIWETLEAPRRHTQKESM